MEHIHRKSVAEQRADARQKVAANAHAGRDPRELFEEANLAWAFEGHLDELQELVDTAMRITSSRPSADERRALARETERVLEQWDAQEKADRLQRAQVEARKRLGLA
jgi:hypothetical protein